MFVAPGPRGPLRLIPSRNARRYAARMLVWASLALPLVAAPGCRPLSCAPAQVAPQAPAGAGPKAAPPFAQAAAGQVHFAVIGDYGVPEQSARDVANLVHSWQPDYVVTTGDNNYNDGAAETLDVNIASLYGRYIAFSPRYRGAYAKQGSAEQRFFPSLGNHDWRTAGAKPYLDAFALPHNGRYYTVRRGPVALFIVDSDKHEPDGNTADSVQAAWLKTALAASDAPHKWVIFHHPPYSLGPHGSSPWMRWPFAAWGATAVFNGHNHDYERYTVDGLTYVVNGMGGADLARLPNPCKIPEASFSHCVGAIYGAMEVVGDANALQVRAVTTAGTEIDRFELRPPPH